MRRSRRAWPQADRLTASKSTSRPNTRYCRPASRPAPRSRASAFMSGLSIAGNCRMCLVEVKGGPPKPSASCASRCATSSRPEWRAAGRPTNSPMVKKAREGVMEFLLDQPSARLPDLRSGRRMRSAGSGDGLWLRLVAAIAENKRAVEDKYIGPLVTHLDEPLHPLHALRPLHRRRSPATGDMGAIGRGEDMEITTYLETAMASELQGNVVDLCPVGALTLEALCVQGAVLGVAQDRSHRRDGCARLGIRIDTRGREVMRILPRINDDVNEEWISDKTRHARRRPEDAAARPALCARGRQAARRRRWREAFAAHRRQGRRPPSPRASAPSPAILPPSKICSRCKQLLQALGVARSRLPPGRRASSIRDSAAPAICSTRTIAGHRAGRRAAARSAPIRAAKRPCSTRASASAG